MFSFQSLHPRLAIQVQDVCCETPPAKSSQLAPARRFCQSPTSHPNIESHVQRSVELRIFENDMKLPSILHMRLRTMDLFEPTILDPGNPPKTVENKLNPCSERHELPKIAADPNRWACCTDPPSHPPGLESQGKGRVARPLWPRSKCTDCFQLVVGKQYVRNFVCNVYCMYSLCV